MNKLWRAYLDSFKYIFSNTTLLTTLILSVLFYSFFYPTAYQAEHAQALPIVIVDEEQSALTSSLISQVSQSPNVSITAVTANFKEAQHFIEQQHADGILLLPSNLSQSLAHGENGGIGLYLSAANFLATKQIALGLVGSVEQSLHDYTARFQAISSFSPAISIHQIALFNPLSGYGSYVFPAVAPLIIHQTILLGMSMLLAMFREQQVKLDDVQLTGLCLCIFTIGCLGCLYLFGFSFWWFDYPRGGNFFGMLLAVPIFIYCMLGITLYFASFLDMPERAGHVIVFSSIPLFMLSGLAWPHAAMPLWMQYAAEVLPSTQIVQMFIQLNQMGVPTYMVLGKLSYLLLIGSLGLLFGYRRMQRQ